MTERRDFDVCVIGGGIAGAALAVALAAGGLTVALVEARALEPPALPDALDLQHFDSRVSALTPASRNLLESLGAWRAIEQYRLCPYTHMTVWDAEGTGRIDFDAAEMDSPALGYIVENRAIVAALLQRCAAQRTLHLFGDAALASCERPGESRMRLRLADGEVLEADLVVAADGARSRVRELMAFDTREWGYGHRALVATVEVERPHEDTAWQRFLTSGPLALLPLPGTARQHYCSIVWSAQEHLADELLGLSDPDFCARLERASEGRLGAVRDCSQRAAFGLRQRHAVDYVQPGVALVADAAHTIHPLAGQGINLGLQDVAVLAREITAGHALGVSPGDLQLLRRYQRQRKGENLLMMAAMDGFKHLFEQRSLPVRWLRNTGMRGVDRLLPLKRQLMRRAMGSG